MNMNFNPSVLDDLIKDYLEDEKKQSYNLFCYSSSESDDDNDEIIMMFTLYIYGLAAGLKTLISLPSLSIDNIPVEKDEVRF